MIKWENLRNERTAEIFQRRMGEKMAEDEEMAVGEATSGWTVLAEKVLGVAREVCGIKEKSVENPWMVGREEEVEEARRRLNGAIRRRNEVAVEVAGGEATEESLEGAKEEVRRERGEWRRTTRRWEREYWDGVIRECSQAEEMGDVGRLYRTLKSIGLKGMKKGKQ